MTTPEHTGKLPPGSYAFLPHNNCATGSLSEFPGRRVLEVDPPGGQEILAIHQEKANDVLERLLGELAVARPSVTDRTAVCLLETADGYHSGHSYEPGTIEGVEHAETVALRKLLPVSTAPIQAIFSTGIGNLPKIKKVAPCFACYDTLAPYFSKTAQLVLFEPNTFDNVLVFSPEAHQDAYRPKQASRISSLRREDIVQELQEKTWLALNDLEFVADLRLLGLEQGIQFYLLGSASGRGGLSNQIHLQRGTPYHDIDFVAVTGKDKEVVESVFGAKVEMHYGRYTKKLLKPTLQPDDPRIAAHYYVENRKIADILVTTSIEEGIVDNAVLQRKFFHQIS